MLRPHRVSMGHFDTLATGRPNATIVDRLKQSSRSRQLVLLRAVLDRASALSLRITPLPALEDAWGLLVEAQRRDPVAVEEVITSPQVGLWAAKALRRLRNLPTNSTPLWADLGYLHLMATSAAVRAGLDFRSRVPVRDGSLVLPTLGLVWLSGQRRWDIADVHGERGQVRVRGSSRSVRLPEVLSDDSDGWQAMRHLRVGKDAMALDICLDDLDPYRGFDEPLPPQRIPATEVRQWKDGLDSAWHLLTEHHPEVADEVSTGLKTLVPRPAVSRFSAFSASHADAFGCVVLSLPTDPVSFAATLVHEFQHSKLGVLLELVDLVDQQTEDGRARYYAPWRDDPRPLGGLLHGIYSFLGVAAFYRSQRHIEGEWNSRLAHYEFAYRLEQITRATRTLVTADNLTALGRRFAAAVEKQLTEWNAEPVPADLLTAAERTSRDHYATWRLRHLDVDTDYVTELARAWLGNRRRPAVRPPEPCLHEPIDLAPGPSARGELIRVSLGEPELFRSYCVDPELVTGDIPGATTADLALIDGDTARAAREYRARVASEPDDPSPWVGLGLAVPDSGLLAMPELVHAVHRRITAMSGTSTDPLRLAGWLERDQ